MESVLDQKELDVLDNLRNIAFSADGKRNPETEPGRFWIVAGLGPVPEELKAPEGIYRDLKDTSADELSKSVKDALRPIRQAVKEMVFWTLWYTSPGTTWEVIERYLPAKFKLGRNTFPCVHWAGIIDVRFDAEAKLQNLFVKPVNTPVAARKDVPLSFSPLVDEESGRPYFTVRPRSDGAGGGQVMGWLNGGCYGCRDKITINNVETGQWHWQIEKNSHSPDNTGGNGVTIETEPTVLVMCHKDHDILKHEKHAKFSLTFEDHWALLEEDLDAQTFDSVAESLRKDVNDRDDALNKAELLFNFLEGQHMPWAIAGYLAKEAKRAPNGFVISDIVKNEAWQSNNDQYFILFDAPQNNRKGNWDGISQEQFSLSTNKFPEWKCCSLLKQNSNNFAEQGKGQVSRNLTEGALPNGCGFWECVEEHGWTIGFVHTKRSVLSRRVVAIRAVVYSSLPLSVYCFGC